MVKKRVRYSRGPHNISVTVDETRPDRCIACGGEFHGRRLNTHHWKTIYTFDEVKEDKQLALENTIKVCVPHHRVANAIKEITDYIQRGHITHEQTINLIKSMPEDMKRVWMRLGDMIEGEGIFL